MPRDVAITGMGAVSALGPNVQSLWCAIEAARCGIDVVRRFDTSELTVHRGALVATGAGADGRDASELCLAFAVCAAREALVSAGCDPPPPRTALVLGTGLVGAEPLDALVAAVARATGIDGACLGVSTACSSSTGALGVACELLALGVADVVLAGGADVVTREVFAGFHALGVLSAGSCAPFSTPPGTTLGEGAGFLVLERTASARRRGARVRAGIAGYGLSADAWHETSPDPKGAGIERALRGALLDAGLPAAHVGYVNAHGSGTQANDSAEWLGIARGLESAAVPVSSSKGALGHAQGAAGALEAIVTIEAMSRQLLPPTLNFAGPRPHAPPDPVPGPRPRPARYECAVSLNSAFGGANAAIVLSREPLHGSGRPRRRVGLRGLGVAGAVSAGDLERLVPGAQTRGLDPASSLLTASAALALSDAGVTLAGERRSRCGLFVGQCRPSPTSVRAFSESIAERGLARLSAAAFARIVLNAAAGFCSKLLGIRGPLTVLSAGPASGLVALALSAEWLATRADTGLMLACGVDESDAASAEAPERESGARVGLATAAACVLLEADDEGGATARGGLSPAITVAGWGIAAPGQSAEAALRAAPDGVARDALVLDTRASDGSPTEGLAHLASAVQALRAGAAASALVASGSGRSLAAALYLVAV